MTSRNKKEANTIVFGDLDQYCYKNGLQRQNAGEGRWVISEKGTDQRRLVKADLASVMSLGASLKLSRFDLDGVSLFCTVGLELPDEIAGLVDEGLNGGMMTAILSELRPMPKATPIEVDNIIGTGVNTLGYEGHEVLEISQLYPTIRVFSGADISQFETPRVFFLICLADRIRAGAWIDAQFRANLELIADLSPIAIPYRILCRSLFDTDPSAVFLALYRCLEALYAYSQTSELMGKLGMQMEWNHVARVLEETLSWRPREEPSLGVLLQQAVSDDLRLMLSALGVALPVNADLVNYATKQMYQLRNSLVHYRSFHQSFDPDAVDWNRLCEATALMVLHIYSSIVGD
ncbi:hypothetical protein [Pseudomonas frederiksbergensis]|uniref:hypothetical protein n=1 Tax=Pseudomonas frederiksbergensis TaxID=104087 RepID=UPI002DBE3362|nr:hypothetical protein [Pseudomonas frederiksbergensis]WRV69861.1 hypothetical protein VQ575_07375 [Pseudomonas frederiksbergensis]